MSVEIKKKWHRELAVIHLRPYNYSMGPILILFTLLPLVVFASPAEEPEESNIPILDSAQELFGKRVNTVANQFDLFFADQRADDELARSRIRIRQNYEVRERAKLTKQTQFRINIRLPKIQDRLKFEFEKKREKEEKAKAKSGSVETIAKNKLDETWQFRADLGVNATIPPRLFSRARLRKNKQTGVFIHRFVEELAWYSDRDWEEDTNLNSDFTINDDWLFRFRNNAFWKITRKDFTTGHGPSLFQRLSENDALSYSSGFSTVVQSGTWYVDNYRVSVNYRRNLYKQWIYVDLIPGLDFPKIWSFRRTPFIQLQFEALFGGF